jgi:hypothetical protein
VTAAQASWTPPRSTQGAINAARRRRAMHAEAINAPSRSRVSPRADGIPTTPGLGSSRIARGNAAVASDVSDIRESARNLCTLTTFHPRTHKPSALGAPSSSKASGTAITHAGSTATRRRVSATVHVAALVGSECVSRDPVSGVGVEHVELLSAHRPGRFRGPRPDSGTGPCGHDGDVLADHDPHQDV